MRVDAFNFVLPEERIALRPARPRESARLLVVRPDQALEHAHVRELPDILQPSDVLVLNNTKVFCAHLSGRRQARSEEGMGATIEVTLYRKTSADSFLALVRPARRLREGDRIIFGVGLEATVIEKAGQGEVSLRFGRAEAELAYAIEAVGRMPLPHYIASRRPSDAADREDYQTIFAADPGSAAAPTAGLHFSAELLEHLQMRGIERQMLTLHVGPGTFLPVSVDDTKDHRMHSEIAILPEAAAEALNAAKAAGQRIVAVGTTSLRTLEAASDAAGRLRPFHGETDLFITPGYRFKFVDALLTNFHLPRSTLFMLVCAFSGLETMKAAYAEAITRKYRFYSYGDACLLYRSTL